jgi:hypothetical protein
VAIPAAEQVHQQTSADGRSKSTGRRCKEAGCRPAFGTKRPSVAALCHCLTGYMPCGSLPCGWGGPRQAPGGGLGCPRPARAPPDARRGPSGRRRGRSPLLRWRPGPERARRTSVDYRPQAQVQADAERAIPRSQAANKSCAAAAARNSVAHPAAFVEKEPPTSVTAPRPTRTAPMAVRTRAQARRWRYSHGAIMRCMPDREGVPQRHQVVVELGAVWSFCAFIGILPVSCGVGYPTT